MEVVDGGHGIEWSGGCFGGLGVGVYSQNEKGLLANPGGT